VQHTFILEFIEGFSISPQDHIALFVFRTNINAILTNMEVIMRDYAIVFALKLSKIFILIVIISTSFSNHHNAVASIRPSTTDIAKSKSPPRLQHAKTYQAVDDISQYWLSEKLDGMRGYWNGTELMTRQGNKIYSPTWFTQHWPKTPMDGELWMARGQFQATISCVRKKYIDEQCWQNVRFMMFDLPAHDGTFTERIAVMKHMVSKTSPKTLAMIPQFKLQNLTQLTQQLNDIVANDGEGLMLHLASARYHIGKTAKLLKLKKHQDGEATVIAHLAGKGKYTNMLGALNVKTAQGLVFKIGSGFSDKERANPPEIGSIITYQYNGTTLSGLPRFARYWRTRATTQ